MTILRFFLKWVKKDSNFHYVGFEPTTSASWVTDPLNTGARTRTVNCILKVCGNNQFYYTHEVLVQQVGLEPTHTTVSEWLTETNRLLPLDSGTGGNRTHHTDLAKIHRLLGNMQPQMLVVLPGFEPGSSHRKCDGLNRWPTGP